MLSCAIGCKQIVVVFAERKDRSREMEDELLLYKIRECYRGNLNTGHDYLERDHSVIDEAKGCSRYEICARQDQKGRFCDV